MLINLPIATDAHYHERITRPEFVHHLLGNGLLQAMLQVTENPACHNALVLHLMNPARFEGRPKSQSLTYHQQLGPEFTLVALGHGGNLYVPHPRQTQVDLKYGLEFDSGLPAFRAHYPAAYTLDGRRAKTVWDLAEELFCPAGRAALVRQVQVTNRHGLAAEPVVLLAFLTPNQGLFPEAHFVTAAEAAVAGHFARGDEFLALAGLGPSSAHMVGEFPAPFEAAAGGRIEGQPESYDDDSFVRPREAYTNYPVLPGSPHVGPALALQFDLGEVGPGETRTVDLAYAYGSSEAEVLQEVAALREQGWEKLKENTRQWWRGTNTLQTGEAKLDKFYRAAQAGLRAGVSQAGQMNAGIWGYNAEWVRDSAQASVGACLSGQFEMARGMLAHMLDHMVSVDGLTFGEGQWYDVQRAELDMNGELLHALWTYWACARDDSLIRTHWAQIRRLAEFPLRPEFWRESVSMAEGERDVRERDKERHGLLPGFELAHQMWITIGLDRAADMARHLDEPALADRWAGLSRRIWEAVLNHPTLALVEDGHLMKRRLVDGSFQRTAQAQAYVHRVDDHTIKLYPRCLNRTGALEPDASEAWPIGHGLVEADSELARRTLDRMELLWNQEWDFGGYPLHNVESEPTKLGPWPMTLYFITQAAAEARRYATVRRNLDWMLSTPDGRGYTWWEYRDVDPRLQIDHGIVPWIIYGEPIILLVQHLIGFRPAPDGITIRPHLLPDMRTARARLRVGTYWIDLTLHNEGRSVARVEVDGRRWEGFDGEAVRLEVPGADVRVEVWLGEG